MSPTNVDLMLSALTLTRVANRDVATGDSLTDSCLAKNALAHFDVPSHLVLVEVAHFNASACRSLARARGEETSDPAYVSVVGIAEPLYALRVRDQLLIMSMKPTKGRREHLGTTAVTAEMPGMFWTRDEAIGLAGDDGSLLWVWCVNARPTVSDVPVNEDSLAQCIDAIAATR